MIIHDNSGQGKVGYRDHAGRNREDGEFVDLIRDCYDHLGAGGSATLTLVRPTEIVHSNANQLAAFLHDSSWTKTFGQPVRGHGGRIRHMWICCWHENIGATWPWSSDSTGYACLSWQETQGHTWDSMISPRINLAGCSSAVFLQTSNSNLQHGSGKLISVKLSPDNGASWPYLLGNDTVQTASIPQSYITGDVRIAWIYEGPVQENRYWCVDDVEIWAEPSRSRDVAVNGIADPCGIMTQGKPVVPSAYVWNHGKQTETLAVTMHIGSNYSDVRWAYVDPYADTLLEFTTWNAVPGSYTATCFTSLDSDECRGNDTAALTFRVVGDTWVSMFPVYGGGGMSAGACLATLDSDDIYCVTGRSDHFAKYVVTQNLWKNRTCTPEEFATGAALAYPGAGNNLYALRGFGSKSFYRYRTDDNYWESRAQFPEKVYSGGLFQSISGTLYLITMRA